MGALEVDEWVQDEDNKDGAHEYDEQVRTMVRCPHVFMVVEGRSSAAVQGGGRRLMSA